MKNRRNAAKRRAALAAAILFLLFCAGAGASAEQNGLETEISEVGEAETMENNARNRDGAEREEMVEVNGVRLSVKEAGTGRDMILIHGRTLSKECMDPLFDYYKSTMS